MKLRITNSDAAPELGVYQITLEDLADKARHPFIATNKWDEVSIEISEDTPKGYLRQLVGMAIVKPVIVGPVTARTMQILCEIYPDESSKLRATFMKGKDEFEALLEKLKKDLNW